MEDKWWGGYYGWRWPHGLNTVMQPLLIGAMNAVLVTGDMGYLDIPRSQIGRMLGLGEPARRITLCLRPATHARLRLRMKRYRFQPSYDQPV